MGDKSKIAGETVNVSASPAIIKYLIAQDAVFERSKFNIRLPSFFGAQFLLIFLIIYLF